MIKTLNKKTIITIGILFLVGIVYHFINRTFNIGIPCIFHEITGLWCPGCGITRMLFQLFNLNFYQAFRYNPLVFILFWLFILFELINLIYFIVKEKRLVIPNGVYYGVIILLLIFAILRNIPEFSYLAPTSI